MLIITHVCVQLHVLLYCIVNFWSAMLCTLPTYLLHVEDYQLTFNQLGVALPRKGREIRGNVVVTTDQPLSQWRKQRTRWFL